MTGPKGFAHPLGMPIRLSSMNVRMIHYQTKPQATQQNKELIQAVFRELHDAMPEGVRYASLTDGNGGFYHLVASSEGSTPLPTFDAFRAFSETIDERIEADPVRYELEIVGSYGMISGEPLPLAASAKPPHG